MEHSRRISKLNRKSGFTLTEVIVVICLIGIIISISAGILVAAMNDYAKGIRIDESKQLGQAVYAFYKERLATARVVSIQDGEGDFILGIDEGSVQFFERGQAREALYPLDMYNEMTIQIHTQVTDGYLLNLEVQVYDGENLLYQKNSSFRLETIKRNAGVIQGNTAWVANPDIYFTP